MCGLAGAVGLEAGPEPVLRMRGNQNHRGPDGEGRWSDAGVSLGHTRLRVIDPTEAGAQPMWTPDGRRSLIYNGEVYNYRRLRDRLRSAGHDFRSDTDTEVVLHAWAQWGPEALERLDGMFAFGLWDREERRLWLARDRLGIKPLYWHHDGEGTFLFASEVRALLASGRVHRRLDRAVLPFYLSQQTAPTPETLIEGVQMLPPGHLAEIRLEEGRAGPPAIRRYWDPLSTSATRREQLAGQPRDALLSELRDRLASAVERRLVADVPLGAFLSGGVDSTAVVALMAEVADEPVRTFTVAFGDEGWDDGPYARLAADRIGTDHHEVVLSDEELVGAVPEAVRAQDHPSGDGINTWIVSRAARKAGLTVALSGLGGDELFGGYPSFRRLRLLARAAPLLWAVPEPVGRAVGRTVDKLRGAGDDGKLADLLATDGSVAEAYPVLRQVFGAHRIEALIGGSVPEPAAPLTERLRQDFRARHSTPLLARVAHAEMTSYMRDVLLRDTDQMSMSHSLEVRVPLLDRELVEYALALPEQARRPGDPSKRWLVTAVDDLLPEEVANRSKSGFALPFDRWMRGPLEDFSRRGLEAVADHAAFQSEAVRSIWSKFVQGDLSWSRPWLLVALGHWVQREDIR